MPIRSRRLAIAGLALLVLRAPDHAQGQVTPPPVPVVFVAGTTGTKLAETNSGKLAWGRTANLFRPRDRGYSLALPFGQQRSEHSPSRLRPIAPLLRVNLVLWKKMIYQPLLEHFLREGRQLGRLEEPTEDDGILFFNYDWRRGNVGTVAELARQLTGLSLTIGASEDAPGDVDLICQSNAAKICRYLVKYGPVSLEQAETGSPRPASSFRIRKLIMVGASNAGSLRTLQLMTRGRRYVPLVGRKISQETFFSVRPLFADLPIQRTDLFIDEAGQPIDADLGDPEDWRRYGWSVWAPRPRKRLDRQPRPDLFGNPTGEKAYLTNQLDRAIRLQRLLAADGPEFPQTRYYLLENASEPTPAKALLRNTNGRWQTFVFPDRKIARNPTLRAVAVTTGDGHATLASQRLLSPQETAALAGSKLIDGGHFEMIIQPEGLNMLSAFLAD